jgi:hypothetical protein
VVIGQSITLELQLAGAAKTSMGLSGLALAAECDGETRRVRPTEP